MKLGHLDLIIVPWSGDEYPASLLLHHFQKQVSASGLLSFLFSPPRTVVRPPDSAQMASHLVSAFENKQVNKVSIISPLGLMDCRV